MKRSMKHRFFAFPLFLAVYAAAAAVVMVLWNNIIPGLTGWGLLTFWHAAGLMLLCRLVFGGLGHLGKFKHGFHHHHGHGCGCRGRFGHGGMEEHIHDVHEHFHEVHDFMKGLSRDERREYIRSQMAGFVTECERRNSGVSQEDEPKQQ